jgi:hypothetical protein
MTTLEKPSIDSLGKKRTCHALLNKSVSWTTGTSNSTPILPRNVIYPRPKEALYTGPLRL